MAHIAQHADRFISLRHDLVAKTGAASRGS